MKTLSLNILDIVQNSIRAKADEIQILIEESSAGDFYRIIISDNGTGISPAILKDVTDPFVTSRTRRKIGLGLPLLKHHSETAGGKLTITSAPGQGTMVSASFIRSHIDRQPLGDISGVIAILTAANPGINFIYRHKADSGEYSFSTKETMDYLETETLSDQSLLNDIKAMINENLIAIAASGLHTETQEENIFMMKEIK